jgi:hypothetical protein
MHESLFKIRKILPLSSAKGSKESNPPAKRLQILQLQGLQPNRHNQAKETRNENETQARRIWKILAQKVEAPRL